MIIICFKFYDFFFFRMITFLLKGKKKNSQIFLYIIQIWPTPLIGWPCRRLFSNVIGRQQIISSPIGRQLFISLLTGRRYDYDRLLVESQWDGSYWLDKT